MVQQRIDDLKKRINETEARIKTRAVRFGGEVADELSPRNIVSRNPGIATAVAFMAGLLLVRSVASGLRGRCRSTCTGVPALPPPTKPQPQAPTQPPVFQQAAATPVAAVAQGSTGKKTSELIGRELLQTAKDVAISVAQRYIEKKIR